MIKYFVTIFKLFCCEFKNQKTESNKIYRTLKDLYIDKYYKKHVDIFRREPKNDEREIFSIAHRIDTVVFILDYFSTEVRFRAKIFPSITDDIVHFKNDKLNLHKEMIYIVRHLGMFDPLIPDIPNMHFFHIAAKGISDLQDSIPLLTSRINFLAQLWVDYKMDKQEFKYKEAEDWVELIWSGSRVKVNYKSYLKDLIAENNQHSKNYVYTNFKKIVFPFYEQDNLPIKFIKISFEHEFDFIKNNFKNFIEKENYENDRCGECDRLLYFSDVRCNRNGFLAHKSCMNTSLGLTENCNEFIKLKNQNLESKIKEFIQEKANLIIERNRPTIAINSFQFVSSEDIIFASYNDVKFVPSVDLKIIPSVDVKIDFQLSNSEANSNQIGKDEDLKVSKYCGTNENAKEINLHLDNSRKKQKYLAKKESPPKKSDNVQQPYKNKVSEKKESIKKITQKEATDKNAKEKTNIYPNNPNPKQHDIKNEKPKKAENEKEKEKEKETKRNKEKAREKETHKIEPVFIQNQNTKSDSRGKKSELHNLNSNNKNKYISIEEKREEIKQEVTENPKDSIINKNMNGQEKKPGTIIHNKQKQNTSESEDPFYQFLNPVEQIKGNPHFNYSAKKNIDIPNKRTKNDEYESIFNNQNNNRISLPQFGTPNEVIPWNTNDSSNQGYKTHDNLENSEERKNVHGSQPSKAHEYLMVQNSKSDEIEGKNNDQSYNKNFSIQTNNDSPNYTYNSLQKANFKNTGGKNSSSPKKKSPSEIQKLLEGTLKKKK